MASMGIYTGVAFTTTGGLAIADSATIEVRRESDSGLAAIFSDRAGTVPIVNPSAFADASGRFSFYAAGLEQGYSVKVSKGAETYTLRNQQLGTAQEFDAVTFMTSLFAAASAAAARIVLGFSAIAAKGDIWVGSALNILATLTVGTDGYPLTPVSGATDGLAYLPPGLGFNLVGGYLDWSVVGSPTGTLSVAIKTWAGNDPSAAEPVFIAFRSPTPATGSLVYRKIVTATSITINDTALLGTVANTAFRLWCVAFDDGGTIRLALINCLSGTSIYPLSGWGIASATLEDNSSDSAHIFYSSGASVSSKAYAVLGYGEWGELAGSPTAFGLPSAGNWTAAPTRIALFGPDMPLPGARIQSQRSQSGAVATGSTTIPDDDTIPQNNEGDQYFSVNITPSSPANVLRIESQVNGVASAGNSFIAAVFQDSIANALAATKKNIASNTVMEAGPRFVHEMLAGIGVATTFKLRIGCITPGTFTLNGQASARLLGGVVPSGLFLEELMA